MNDWSDGWTKEGVWVSLTKVGLLRLAQSEYIGS